MRHPHPPVISRRTCEKFMASLQAVKTNRAGSGHCSLWEQLKIQETESCSLRWSSVRARGRHLAQSPPRGRTQLASPARVAVASALLKGRVHRARLHRDEANHSERSSDMEHIVARLLDEFEHGRMNRRQLIQSLSAA